MSEELLYDLRTVKRNLSKGLITEADYKNFLKKIKDSKDNSEEIKVDREEEGENLEMPSSKDF